MADLDENGCNLLLAAIIHRAKLDIANAPRGCDPEELAAAREWITELETDCADLVVLHKPGHRTTAQPNGLWFSPSGYKKRRKPKRRKAVQA